MARLILRRKAVIKSECKGIEDYQKEAFNATNTSEDEEYKDRRLFLLFFGIFLKFNTDNLILIFLFLFLFLFRQ